MPCGISKMSKGKKKTRNLTIYLSVICTSSYQTAGGAKHQPKNDNLFIIFYFCSFCLFLPFCSHWCVFLFLSRNNWHYDIIHCACVCVCVCVCTCMFYATSAQLNTTQLPENDITVSTKRNQSKPVTLRVPALSVSSHNPPSSSSSSSSSSAAVTYSSLIINKLSKINMSFFFFFVVFFILLPGGYFV